MSHQYDFLFSKARHTGLVGGYGSGKSFIGTLKTVAKKLQYPSIDVAYYLPTYPLIKQVAFPRFAEVLESHNVDFDLNLTDKTFHTDFGDIVLRSMMDEHLIVGYEVGYSIIDEADVLPKQKMWNVFRKVVARNRSPLPDGDENKTDFVSTPEGFRFLYDFFVTKANDNKALIKGSTYSNKNLSHSYIETLLDSYDENQRKAYLNGEFIDLQAGRVYNCYDKENNSTRRTIQQGDTLHIGLDFNITNMNAVIHVIEGGTIYAVAEIVKQYDTDSICKALKRFSNQIIIYPDASGNNRKTSGATDFEIIRSYGFKIRSPRKNPLVRDRINTINTALRNGEYKVNDEKCPFYAEALNGIGYKNQEPDKTSGYDHITDAGGYMVYFEKTSKRKKTRVYGGSY